MHRKIHTAIALVVVLLTASLQAGDENHCSATTHDCEKKIREMLSGKKFLGIIYDDSQQNLIVKGVVRGSAAERAGLKPGDVLLAVNGENCREKSARSFKKLVSSNNDKESVVIKLRREGVVTEVVAALVEITPEQMEHIIAAHVRDAHQPLQRKE